jgi:membrane-bound ClpP family serine protease
VLEKIEECVGSFLLLYLLEMLTINILGLLLVSMVLTLIVIEGFYGMNWLVCSIGEICCGALRELQHHSFPSERSREAPFCPAMVEL